MKDLIGRRFGRLTVVRDANKRKRTYHVWVCECECGNVVEVAYDDLIKGHTKSCGCLRREIMAEKGRKYGASTKGHPGIKHSTRQEPNKNSHSPVRGVCWVNKRQQWKAQIMHKRKSYHLCWSSDISYAAEVRHEAEEHVKNGDFESWYLKFKNKR